VVSVLLFVEREIGPAECAVVACSLVPSPFSTASVKTGKAQIEQMISAVRSIVLQKSPSERCEIEFVTIESGRECF
jgi:hypothetical protein